MKKYLFTLLFFFSAINVSSQIQRRIFNFNLGRTTQQEVINYFRKQHKGVRRDTDGHIYVSKASFAGKIWPEVSFDFYRNKLYSAMFMDCENSTPRKILELEWHNMHSSLMKKYGNYVKEDTSEVVMFSDGKTVLLFDYQDGVRTKCMSLSYTDLFLYNLKEEKESNEL